MNKTAIGIILVILIAFALILGATGLVGMQFGKTGEMVALSIVAVILFIGFIKSKGEK